MNHQQELELLAEWLGLKRDEVGPYVERPCLQSEFGKGNWVENVRITWNPLTNDTDFLNMVAEKEVDFKHGFYFVFAALAGENRITARYSDHPSKLAAMKHAAYQVCLMAAREWKEGKE